MNKLHLTIAFLLGVVAWQAVFSLATPVSADVSANAELVAVGVRMAPDREFLAVIDADRHLALYDWRGGNELKLLQVRNIERDLRLDFYSLEGSQSPTVKEIDAILKGR